VGNATNLLPETTKGTNDTEDKLNKIQKTRRVMSLKIHVYARSQVFSFFEEARGFSESCAARM
jgi:hypothetical protein